jgi:hypothetical protein
MQHTIFVVDTLSACPRAVTYFRNVFTEASPRGF